jgi:hypothetical protein
MLTQNPEAVKRSALDTLIVPPVILRSRLATKNLRISNPSKYGDASLRSA